VSTNTIKDDDVKKKDNFNYRLNKPNIIISLEQLKIDRISKWEASKHLPATLFCPQEILITIRALN